MIANLVHIRELPTPGSYIDFAVFDAKATSRACRSLKLNI